MKDISLYSISDFVLDESFQQWVLQPTAENDIVWQNFLEENPEKSENISKAKKLVLNFREDNDTPPIERMDAVWNKIKQQTIEHKEVEIISLAPKKTYSWLRIAASITLVVGLCGSIYYYLNANNEIIYQSAFGESKNVTLPDGSVVKLNANSTLKTSKDWSGTDTREVWLDGEAFFTVTKKPSRGDAKFIVHAKQVDVEVLGTEFNVSDRDTNTDVTLNSGKIKLEVHKANNTETIMMKPGEQVSYSSNSLIISKKEVKAETISAWTNNRWMLESTSLNEIANKIEHTFGLEVIIKDSLLAQERMTGVIVTNNLDEVLEGISTIYSLKVKKEKNQIILEK
jgi:transmembrane sensor